MDYTLLETALSYAALGLLVGFGYYGAAVWMTMAAQRSGSQALGWGLHGLRIATAIIFFLWVASIGAIHVLAAFVGFLVGRQIVFSGLGRRE